MNIELYKNNQSQIYNQLPTQSNIEISMSEDPKIQSIISKIENIIESFRLDNQSLLKLIPLFNKLEKKLETLEKKKYLQIDVLRNKFFSEENVSNCRLRIQKCIDSQKLLEKGNLQNYDLNIHFDWKFCDLKEHLISQKQYDLLVKLYQVQERYSNPLQINKEIFHFAMDKLQILDSSRYRGNYPILTSNAVLKAFSKITTEIQDPVLSELEQWLTPLLKELGLLSGLSFIQNREPVVTERIIENIKKLKVGDSYLVPTGFSGHETCLLITKNKKDKFTLIHYNTGAGSHDSQYRWENSNLYQTYIAIDDIPIESILNKEGWKTLWESKYSASNMDPTYKTIYQVLGKDGTKRPASTDVEDYEAQQCSATCAMQVFMALIKHQIMQRVEGAKCEQEAYYKMIKASMILHYAKEHWSEFEENIQQYLSPIMTKLQADLEIYEIAKSSEQYNKIAQEITLLLKHYDEKELSEQWMPKNDNHLSRYAALRNVSNVLANIWLKNPERVPTKKTEALCFSLAKYAHKKIILNNIEKTFDKQLEEKNFKNLANELFFNFRTTPYEDFIIDYIVRQFGKNTPPLGEDSSDALTIFMIKQNSSRLQSDRIIKKLQKKITEQGNLKLAQWIDDTWIKFEKDHN